MHQQTISGGELHQQVFRSPLDRTYGLPFEPFNKIPVQAVAKLWLADDDAVRTFLAKKLGVPAEQVKVVKVVEAKTGKVYRLAAVRLTENRVVREAAIEVLAFTPDGNKLHTSSDGAVRVYRMTAKATA